MNEVKKETNVVTKKPAVKKESKVKENSVLTYRSMKELERDELKSLPKYNVRFELLGSEINPYVKVTVLFHKRFRKVLSVKCFDINKYNLLIKRRNLDPNQTVHVIEGIFRFFNGSIPGKDQDYHRLEMYVFKGMVITDFFTWSDMELINDYEINLDFKTDPNNNAQSLYGELVDVTVDDWL